MPKNIKNITILFILPFLLINCAKDKNAEDAVLKKKRFEPNMEKRIMEEAEKTSIFSRIGKGSGNYEFRVVKQMRKPPLVIPHCLTNFT